MRKAFCILFLLLLLPLMCRAQSIFIDYYIQGEIDQSIFWVLTDANNDKYCGNCDITLGLDPNAYVQDHMDEWLQAIYAMNSDPNVPDWVDSHIGRYQQGLDMADGIDTWTEQRIWNRKILKTIYPVVGLPD